MRDERRYGMQDTPDRIAELEAKVARLEAEVKLQSDSADHWEDEAMKHMSRAAELQATIERLEAVIGRMLPKLREHMTDEYIKYELIKGTE